MRIVFSLMGLAQRAAFQQETCRNPRVVSDTHPAFGPVREGCGGCEGKLMSLSLHESSEHVFIFPLLHASKYRVNFTTLSSGMGERACAANCPSVSVVHVCAAPHVRLRETPLSTQNHCAPNALLVLQDCNSNLQSRNNFPRWQQLAL